MLEVVDDADRVNQVELVSAADLVGASLLHLYARKAGKRSPSHCQGSIVHIDRKPPFSAICHRPVRVATHAAPDIEERHAPPVLGLEVSGPTAKLFFIFGAQLGVVVPFIAKAVRRTGSERHFGIVGFVNVELGHLQATTKKRVSVAGNSTKSSIPALFTIVFRPSEPFS